MLLEKAKRALVISAICYALLASLLVSTGIVSRGHGMLIAGTLVVIRFFTSLAVLAGLILSERHTSAFPQGLYKLENLVATGIGLLILFSSYELGKEAIERIVSKETSLEQPWLVIVVMSAVAAVTFFLALYKGRVGKRDNYPSLRADARHSYTDLVASAAIIVGVGLEMAGVPKTDAIAALVVVVFLVWSGIGVTVDGLKVLLDASIEKEVLHKAREIVQADPRVREVLGVLGRNSGSYRFLTVSLVP